jgi:hypothetical protein
MSTASDGHAYRSTTTPGIAVPLGLVTVPAATAASDDAELAGKEPKARSGKTSAAANRTRIGPAEIRRRA